MATIDTIMSGNAGTRDLAGVAIGSSLWMPIFTGITGILLAITPIIAQLVGAGQKKRVPFAVIQGTYIAVAISLIVIFCGSLALKPILHTMHLEPSVRDIARRYLMGISFGITPMFIYTILRCFMDSLGQTRMSMFITLLSLPINIGLNYLLIFGKLGFPRLGGVGAGYATAITYWCILLIAFYVVHRVEPFSDYGIFNKIPAVSLFHWKEQLKLGIPIGFTIFFETSVFSGVTLLMSQYDTITIAAHQAALNFASLLYMIPLSISMALTIAVGFEVGARRYADAKQYSLLGLGIALGMAVCCGIGLLLFGEQVAGIYTSDKAVFQMAKQFLIYAIFFQLSDAIATPVQGILRGYKDVNISFLVAFTSYWVIGLPVGHLLSLYTNLGPFGYWGGLIVGLALGATSLLYRMFWIQKNATAGTVLDCRNK
ncbi:MATE family efflux transporter [Desulfotomaculum defluvii]